MNRLLTTFFTASIIIANIDPARGLMFYTGAILSMVAAFVLRVAMEWKNNTLTKKSFTIQAIITSCVCFIGYIVWRDYKIKFSLELYMFFLSLFAVFIAYMIDEAGKVGIKNAVKTLLKYLLGRIDTNPEEKI